MVKTLKFIYRIIILCISTKGHPVVCFTWNGKANGVLLEQGRYEKNQEGLNRLAGQLEDFAIELRKGTIQVQYSKQ